MQKKLSDVSQDDIDIALAQIKLHLMDNLLAEIGLGNAMSLIVLPVILKIIYKRQF